MSFTIIFSEKAKSNIEKIAEYLDEEWSENVKLKFLTDISKAVKQLAIMPFMFPSSDKMEGLRRCVVNRHTVLYYRINQEIIEVINIKGTRQSPNII
jgi:plasmid stabilization system protein ParE